MQDDEIGEDPWIDEFKLLRRRVFHWQGIDTLSPPQDRLPLQTKMTPCPLTSQHAAFLGFAADWAAVDPLEYLTPFMEVIRSPETSGPVTGVALTAVARFLDAYIIGE